MKIGIDARFLGPKGKGLGRYTQKLIEELEKIDGQNQYVIFLRRQNWNEFKPSSPNFKKVLADCRWYSLGEQIFLPIKIYQQKIDLMHFPHFNVPVFYFGKFIVTIHDLILRHFKTQRATTRSAFVYWFKGLGYRLVIWLAVKRAQKIITVSNYVKKDIVNTFNIDPDKVAVTYEGAPTRSLKVKVQNSKLVLERYKINRPYFLYVGNAYPHKNLEKLIEALGILIEKYGQDLRLVLVGEDDYFYHRLKKVILPILQSMGKMNNIIFAGFVDDENLSVLYQSAELYVFPSLCEGFGLPPLEAMACGLPVVCSGATCLPEILGEAALYFDAKDPEDMAKRIDQALIDEGLRQNLISRGYEQIKKYSWQRMAQETLRIYNFM